ncbi:MAG: hypothetical protein ACYTBS_19800, partial [Planctomycetota bacterium]
MTTGKYHHRIHSNVTLCLLLITLFCAVTASVEARTYPKKSWQTRRPQEVGLNPQKIDAIAELLAGRGCVVKGGYVVKSWEDQSRQGGWMSSSKPVISTLLFFAIQESKLDSVHTPIERFDWDLSTKDQTMTF